MVKEQQEAVWPEQMRERMVGNEIRDVGKVWTVWSHKKTGIGAVEMF